MLIKWLVNLDDAIRGKKPSTPSKVVPSDLSEDEMKLFIEAVYILASFLLYYLIKDWLNHFFSRNFEEEYDKNVSNFGQLAKDYVKGRKKIS